MIDLFQRNGEVCIPLLISDRGYGVLWHNPGVGRVELATTGTRWVADAAPQLDYLVFAGDPAQVLARYAENPLPGILQLLTVTVALLGATRLLWLAALRRYGSASS